MDGITDLEGIGMEMELVEIVGSLSKLTLWVIFLGWAIRRHEAAKAKRADR